MLFRDDLREQRRKKKMFKRLALKFSTISSEYGASMVEYALLVVLIAIVALVAVALAGSQLSTTYSEIASEVGNA
jgi:pilus assembly protein Flp/PilA